MSNFQKPNPEQPCINECGANQTPGRDQKCIVCWMFDTDSDDSESEPDYSKLKRTREGYAKDDFVVSDSEEVVVRSKKPSTIVCSVCDSTDEVHYSGCIHSEEEMNRATCWCGKTFCRGKGGACYILAVVNYRIAMDLDVVV